MEKKNREKSTKCKKTKVEKEGMAQQKKKQWEYYSKIDSIMSEKPIVNPPSIVIGRGHTSHGTLKDTGEFKTIYSPLHMFKN